MKFARNLLTGRLTNVNISSENLSNESAYFSLCSGTTGTYLRLHEKGNSMKKLTALLMAVIMTLSFAACGTEPKAESNVTDNGTTPAPVPEISEEVPSAAPEAEETPEVPEAPESPAISAITVTYYRGDESAEKLVSEAGEIPELSAQALMDLLYEKEVLSSPVTVNSFTVDNNNIIQLDVSSNFSELVNSMGTAGETIIIGSLVNTLLDAFEADGLYIKVDGEDLATGHNIYDFVLTFTEN